MSLLHEPVSTAIPSQGSFRDITTTRKHRHLGEILKYVFSYVFFKTVLHKAKHSTGTPNIGFRSYSQELVYICSCYKFFCSLLTQAV